MAYYGQPIMEGLKGLGQSIRQYGQTGMQTQLGMGQQQVDMAKMESEAPLRQMQLANEALKYKTTQEEHEREQAILDEEVDTTGDDPALLRTLAKLTDSHFSPAANKIFTSDGQPLKNRHISDNDTKSLIENARGLLKGPLEDTVEGNKQFLNQARSAIGSVSKLTGKKFSEIVKEFPRYATSQARVTELGKAEKEKTFEKESYADYIKIPGNKKVSKFAFHKMWKKTEKDADKPLTTDKINKRLVSLHKAKSALQTRKGLSPEMFAIMKSLNPDMELEGDTTEATAEIDRQIGYYDDLLKGSNLGSIAKPKRKTFPVRVISGQRQEGETIDEWIKRTGR